MSGDDDDGWRSDDKRKSLDRDGYGASTVPTGTCSGVMRARRGMNSREHATKE